LGHDDLVQVRQVTGPDGRVATVEVEQHTDPEVWTVRVRRGDEVVAEKRCGSELQALQAWTTYRMLVTEGDL
jgi:hypothetical protein